MVLKKLLQRNCGVRNFAAKKLAHTIRLDILLNFYTRSLRDHTIILARKRAYLFVPHTLSQILAMKYLKLIARLTAILGSTKLQGDKAAYFACRTVCEEFEQNNNEDFWRSIGYTRPVKDDDF